MSALSELSKRIVVCTKCPILVNGRTRVVPGEGNEHTDIMFIGEAPGYNEDQQGRPFVGQAGKFLNHLLESINLSRETTFITNVIKCRPPGNRDPLPSEIQNCQPWLEEQIKIIQPKIIVTLGRYSMARYFPGKTISKIHGTWVKQGDLTIFAMYHPAAALHQANLRSSLEEDIKKLPPLLEEIRKAALPPPPPPKTEEKPQQLSMF